MNDSLKNKIKEKQGKTKLPFSNCFFRFTEKASVFECGDGFYSVIWVTNFRGSGWVTYTFEGKEYKVNDQRGGNIRSNDTIHSVRVPKEHLNGNTYRYHSQYVAFKFGYSAIKGVTISSPEIKFKGEPAGDKTDVLVLSDIHGDLPPCESAVDCFKGDYDLLVLNGDISSSIVFKKDFTDKVLGFAYIFSKGEIPVAYTRGNHETRGSFASEVPAYFGTKTGGLYFTFRHGPLFAAVLDTGEDKPDDHIEYSGLVDYQAYIDGETQWLNGLRKDESDGILYRAAFAHMPDVNSRFGNNWNPALEKLGTQVVISGHTHSFELHSKYNSEAKFITVIEGGKISKGDFGFIACRFTFAPGGAVRALAYDKDKNKVADEMIEI